MLETTRYPRELQITLLRASGHFYLRSGSCPMHGSVLPAFCLPDVTSFGKAFFISFPMEPTEATREPQD